LIILINATFFVLCSLACIPFLSFLFITIESHSLFHIWRETENERRKRDRENKHRQKNNLKTGRDQYWEKERYRNRAEKKYVRKLRERLDKIKERAREVLTNKGRKERKREKRKLNTARKREAKR